MCAYECCSRFFSIILFYFVSTLWLFLVQLDIYPFLQTWTHTIQSNSHTHTHSQPIHLLLSFNLLYLQDFNISLSVHTFSIDLALPRILPHTSTAYHSYLACSLRRLFDEKNIFQLRCMYAICFNIILSCLSDAFVAIVVALYVTLCMVHRYLCVCVRRTLVMYSAWFRNMCKCVCV